MQEWHLVVSRGPESENNTTRSGPNSTISRCFAKYGKRWQRRKSFRIWSGLSESNRHLNLGKVPYYHYTKAAQLHSFYNTAGRVRTSVACAQRPIIQPPGKQNSQETWVIRADFTTGERRWRSAKRVAFSLSV
jgi:hypothetical protein